MRWVSRGESYTPKGLRPASLPRIQRLRDNASRWPAGGHPQGWVTPSFYASRPHMEKQRVPADCLPEPGVQGTGRNSRGPALRPLASACLLPRSCPPTLWKQHLVCLWECPSPPSGPVVWVTCPIAPSGHIPKTSRQATERIASALWQDRKFLLIGISGRWQLRLEPPVFSMRRGPTCLGSQQREEPTGGKQSPHHSCPWREPCLAVFK